MKGGNSGGSQKERHVSSVPPAVANLPKRRMRPGMLELPQGLKANYLAVRDALREHNYDESLLPMVRRSYGYAKSVHKGKTRKGGIDGAEKEPYIVHPGSVATRAARLGLPLEDVCAAFLHDTIEESQKTDHKVTPEDILKLLSGVDPAFGKRVAELVIRLTKPKYNAEREEWVFANDPRYYQIKDDYVEALYDQRSDAYYAFLLNSGDIDAIALKLLDNLHNAESMAGIKDAQRQKNFRTMANKTLKLARLVFVEEDVQYFISLFEKWGFHLPPTVDKLPPHGAVVEFPRRDMLDEKALIAHPDPTYAFISIYGNAMDAFTRGSVEIGIPPGLGITQGMILPYLPQGFSLTQQKSMVSESFPTHEIIFRVFGFYSESIASSPVTEEPRQLFLAGFNRSGGRERRRPTSRRSPTGVSPSAGTEGFFDICDGRGRPVASISGKALTSANVVFRGAIAEDFARSEAKYESLKSALGKIYEEVIRPALERSSLTPIPPSTEGNPSS